MEETGAQARAGFRANRKVLLGALALGHGVHHFFLQGFWVILPTIKADMGLSPIQASLLVTSRQLLGGVLNFPLGLVSDLLRRRWRIILAATVLWSGLAYVLAGIAPNFILLVLAASLLGVGNMAWHAPALSLLSRRFAERRGFAIAMHSGGASAGETLAPLAAGFLLVSLSWRLIFDLAGIPAVLIGLGVWWALSDIGGAPTAREGGRSYLATARVLLRNRSLLMLTAISTLQSAGRIAFLTFFAIYLKEDLKYSNPVIGVHLTLLTLLGVASGPALGFLSDRLGRKPVMVAGLMSSSLGVVLLAYVGGGWQFTGLVVYLGLTFYAVTGVIIASAMDVAKSGVEGVTVGVLFSGSAVSTVVAPIAAGIIVTATSANASAFYFAAALMFCAALLSTLTSLPRAGRRTAQD